MAKKKKKKSEKSTGDVSEIAGRIWLAGLGALSTAEEEGSKAFKKLVEKGKELEGKGKDRVQDRVDKAKDVAESAWDGIASMVDEKVSDALHRMGVPTREEIRTLTRKVEELTAKVKSLETAPSPAKAPAKKAPAKQATAKKAPAKSTARKTTSRKTSTAKKAAPKAEEKKTEGNEKLKDA